MASFLEVIAPVGFENFFLEVAEMFSGPAEPPAEDLEVLAQSIWVNLSLGPGERVDRETWVERRGSLRLTRTTVMSGPCA